MQFLNMKTRNFQGFINRSIRNNWHFVGGSRINPGNQKLPYFRSGKWKCSAHFSGFVQKNCKRNRNILFRSSENKNCQYDCHGYRILQVLGPPLTELQKNVTNTFMRYVNKIYSCNSLNHLQQSLKDGQKGYGDVQVHLKINADI